MNFQNPNWIVPTAPPGTSNNQAASTQFVARAISSSGVTSVTNSDGSLTISPTTGAVVASLNPTVKANFVYVKDGVPWADVKAWGALGDGSTNDYTAIQNAINYIKTYNATVTGGGGIVFFPPGNYIIGSTLVVEDAPILLLGCGVGVSYINTTPTVDMIGINFTESSATIQVHRMGIRDMSVFGCQNATAAQPLVFVDTWPVEGRIENCFFFGGCFALKIQGTDWRTRNLRCENGATDAGSHGCAHVYSLGANYYSQCKFDAGNPTYAFLQGPYAFTSSAVCENQITDCDFSINGGTGIFSVYIDDGGTNQVITKFTDCVLGGAATHIQNHKWTGFSLCEFPGGSFGISNAAAATTTFSNCFAFSPVVVSGNHAVDNVTQNIS